MKATYDVAIVGAGLVGGTLALALQDQPVSVVAVDAVSGLSHDQRLPDHRSFGLSLSTAVIFKTLGLWPDLVDQTMSIDHIHVSDRGHFGTTRFSASEVGMEALGYVVPASALVQAIQARLEMCCGGLDRYEGYQVTPIGHP